MTEQEYHSGLNKIIRFQCFQFRKSPLRIHITGIDDLTGEIGNSIRISIGPKGGRIRIQLLKETNVHDVVKTILCRELWNIEARQNLSIENSFKYLVVCVLQWVAIGQHLNKKHGISDFFTVEFWEKNKPGYKHSLGTPWPGTILELVRLYQFLPGDPTGGINYGLGGLKDLESIPLTAIWGLIPGDAPVNIYYYLRNFREKKYKTWEDFETTEKFTRKGLMNACKRYNLTPPRMKPGRRVNE
ncbi:MAG: hypothetical protein A2487_00020 [Candidatus Raymondbacteria bacterium RifOxyC12_full_50_8]|uniref:Uncharacterized protein n=1 Tax=Candidatus Raymondbacteria bacterium RIFOXYD12_FULL_49_13 TaxID=1817890 RepID=A0A1F7F739_UNCRA|nr:MAG: hypothetical protein A2248_21985 [Candidatus Raymondbacteria bacterium RIFOXYA2_FULL_49_16]OGJ88423.1 MAG: hypothetical protein A2350_11295 [Candidatus Raymondbacteria bacterium RifOxyB12_full_50_8]OGJ96288.1 MAG: hypothetical protein A2453_08855 [Candidatus Raymondbacteria bacterium RIFOXYC2_FULL_50_21]OGK02495.1 MAG: hypothetical protein A2519_12200 [Candidatus Raymondbacteria bacterium RIFOXYD12_FULL_49_13]OGK03133.1 MAG: hypothetical protein A2487_00020 [Candidatus Raymondbacteria b